MMPVTGEGKKRTVASTGESPCRSWYHSVQKNMNLRATKVSAGYLKMESDERGEGRPSQCADELDKGEAAFAPQASLHKGRPVRLVLEVALPEPEADEKEDTDAEEGCDVGCAPLRTARKRQLRVRRDSSAARWGRRRAMAYPFRLSRPIGQRESDERQTGRDEECAEPVDSAGGVALLVGWDEKDGADDDESSDAC